ncbi:hypothetical protein [Paraburkholderia strydomiana]|nr:hypothetical protein [Paraburkholderia strydomiana]
MQLSAVPKTQWHDGPAQFDALAVGHPERIQFEAHDLPQVDQITVCVAD